MGDPVILKGSQEPHGADILRSTLNYGLHMNTSPTGSGKTIAEMWLHQQLVEFHNEPVVLLVVAPAAIKPTKRVKEGTLPISPWQREGLKYGIKVRFISYETIRGTNLPGKVTADSPDTSMSSAGELPGMPNSKNFEWMDDEEEAIYGDFYSNLGNVVARRNEKVKVGKKYSYETTFSPTKSFMQYCVDNNIFVVFDEAHFAKNDTTQNHSCAAIIRAVRRARIIKRARLGLEEDAPGGGAYFALLTATPMDKEKHASTYFKLIGSNNPVDRLDMIIGFGQRAAYDCYKEAVLYDESKANKLGIKKKIIDKRHKELKIDNAVSAIMDLWIECVLAKTQYAMIDTTIKQLYNGFLIVEDADDMKIIEKGHRLLKEAAKASRAGNKTRSLQLMTEASQYTEKGMVKTMVRFGMKKLREAQGNKLIIALTYIENVNRGIDEAQLYYDGEIGRIGGKGKNESSSQKTGRKKDKERTVRRFQINDSMEVLFTTKQSGGSSINLQDQIGRRKRIVLMSGDHNITMTQQISGRAARHGSQSVPEIYICYPKTLGPSAMKIYNSNITKSTVMKRALEIRDVDECVNKECKWADLDLQNRMRIIYKNFVKLPGEYDRFIELDVDCTDISYLTDSEVFNIRTGLPINPDEDFGWIENNDEEGRHNYRDTDYLIKYLDKMCNKGYTSEDMPGIYFATPLDEKVNLFPPSKYPEITIFEAKP